MTDDSDLVERVRTALRTVIDPEIGLDIVEIGLVYDIAVEEEDVVRISMTTTTMGCPATSYLRDGAGEAAQSVAGVHAVDVQLTYDPPWTPDMMSADARNYLGVGR
ncbi:metal-sulfur cluster assembly factor [Bradyrhizobium sp.]|uniref:metal-sulfur cluster assembly factor n=1 Tax=Bradyrhizobium sp. TaxID=376 RepID=UPI00238DB4D0|nr:metal-sulfur cluster assembly factor [Bradyrhizobium sp.]MDE2379948.1 metal-sulfur cluster assembly factor [Bradyrhizobium sp.]